MQVKVLFFGVLSEVTGTDCKYYREVKSINELRHKIMDEYPGIEHYSFRISLNNELIDEDRGIADNDEVALMPPFAGG